MDSSKMKVVYVIAQRNNKSYWNRIGVAFVNSDGSLNVRLEALPVSGELQIRDYVPREDGAGFGLGRERQVGNGGHEVLAELG
ncbi:hypothetical protein ACFL5O_03850 [Myxococcota bacterium]